ncbi:MAG: DUF192 domain-containing protein [Acidimicrobiia bacterium]|nr:DUF192 domain-containing protein [Acidimicrobiia bacterium]
MVVAACSPNQEQPNREQPATSSTTTNLDASTTTALSTTPTTSLDQEDLSGWEVATVSVEGEDLLVAVADDASERAQGLMGVEDLGDLDGMLFVFPAEATGGFWMKDTILPLDIAFFAADGTLVEVLTMEPCQADPCRLYVPSSPYLWALEAPAGTLVGLSSESSLVVP